MLVSLYITNSRGYNNNNHHRRCRLTQIDLYNSCIIQVNLRQPAPPVKNWRILLVQSFTARMPLLTATSAFGLGRRRWSSPQQCYLHGLCTFKFTWTMIRKSCRHHWFLCTHTHPFNRVSRYQKGKTNLDFTYARDSEWQWHQLGHMQVCISLQADNNALSLIHI